MNITEAAVNLSATLHDAQSKATTRIALPVNVAAAWQLLDEALRSRPSIERATDRLAHDLDRIYDVLP